MEDRPPRFRTAINVAAEEAAARSERLMEAVLTETLRMFREQLTAEMTGIKDTTEQLAMRVKAQDDFSKRVLRLAQEAKKLAEASNSQHLSTLVEQTQANQAELKQATEQLAASVQA
mmetsp:Transcript_149022/g.271211  ORF Transcript_149022/g.271211 Transcript_149022/m.271211 type:complete len:117 (-) Transcript_149022:4-354(-)